MGALLFRGPAQRRVREQLHAGLLRALHSAVRPAVVQRLPHELEKSGAKVIDIAAYRTVSETDLGKTGGHDVYRMLLNKSIDVVTFTSASTVQNFVKSLGSEQASDLLAATLVASIGPVTADAAKQLDIRTSIMPSVYTVPALVQEIVNHFNHQPKTI